MEMMQSDPGNPIGKKIKRTAFRVKTKMKQAQQQRRVTKMMKEEAKRKNASPGVPPLGEGQLNKGGGTVVRDVEKAKKKDAMKRKIKGGMGKIGDFIGGKADDMRTNISKRRYEKGKGPRGERATESGSATDEKQFCGPKGCTTKAPKGLGSRRN
jgi:hypothetical protein